MKEKILITSLARVSKNTPWRVGIYTNDNYTFFNVGEKGNVAMSPRFNMFLDAVEKKVTRYPVDVSFHPIKDNREMEITKIRNQIVYVDCGFTANRLIPNARFYYDKEVFSNPLAIKQQKTQDASGMFSLMDVSENIASTALQYIAVGRVEQVTDGDTIDVTLLKMSDFLSSRFDTNEKVTIRFNGVDTPEKYQEGAEEYKDPKNTKFGKLYGVTMQDMYTVGGEAYEYTKKLLGWNSSNKPLVILNFDRQKDGDDPMMDAGYGRYVADVYATSEKNAEIAMEKVEQGKSFVHVPKTLLTTKSKSFPQVPLGLFQYEFAYDGSSILNPFDWVSELGLKGFDPGNQYTPDNLQSDTDPDVSSGDVQVYDTNLNTDTINFSSTDGPTSNNLDFFEPYDDRLGDFTKGIKSVADLKKHSKVRIGDVILTIPPTSIEVNKTSNISKVKTLRTKSSVLVNRGQTLTTLSLNLYFHDLESINGTQYPWRKDYKKGEKQKHFFVDGLRPLLAQFTKTPFVPIDNYYINDVLGIRDVALMDIEVTTVPNFPESLTATLTLVEFNCEAYLMDQGTLGDSINYPLMRWFYNQAMANRGEKYRYFKGLDAPIKSDISFTLADEEFLSKRKEAIQYIKKADSPEKVRVEMKTKNTSYKAKKEDEKVLSKIVSQYEVYSKAKIKKYTVIDYFNKSGLNGLSNRIAIADQLIDKYNIKKETADNAILEGIELFTEMYDGEYKSEMTVLKNQNIFLPYESRLYYKSRFDWNGLEGFFANYDEEPPVDYSEEPYKGQESKGLVLFDKLTDIDNQAKLEKKFKKYYDSGKGRFIIPASSDAMKTIKEVANSAKDMMDSVDAYEEEFNEILGIIDASEAGIPMKEFEISGNIIPISLNARFSNEYSISHVQSGEAATLQYMGGGDPYVDIILEVDEDAAKDINRLVAISDYYAKTYNQGITNGYIGIQNDLAQLFGIRYIMFENLSINTVPNFPDRYQIMIRAIGFDKTQRQREELTALPGNTDHMDIDMLTENKGAFASDRMIESRLHQLEVYPDLELPTYSQLNKDLPEFDAGSIKEYVNLNGGTYVDPDFYFSTVSTFRKMVEEEYTSEHRLNMFDATGVAAYTSSTDAEQVFNTTDTDWKKLQDMQTTEGVEPIGWVFRWGEGQQETQETATASTGTLAAEQGGTLSAQNPDVQSFLTAQENGAPTYNKFPTLEEWNKLFPKNDYVYNLYSSQPGADETLIYQELSYQIDKYFKKYYSAPNFIKECRGDLKDADKSKKRVSYSVPNDFYAMYFDYQRRTQRSFKEVAKIDELTKDKKITRPSETDSVDAADFRKTDKKITKERFMTLFKAFLDKMSGWQHYKGKGPLVSKTGRVGLAQVDITGKDMTVDEVKRLMYNWRYNLEVAVKQLLGHFKKAKKLNDDCTNFEVFCRPWDAMFALYEKPDAKLLRSSDVEESDFASGVMSRFTAYATKPFNTFSGFNEEVYKQFAGLSMEEQTSVGGGNETDYVNSLLELEYYDQSVLKKAGLTINSDKKNIKKAMKKYLSEQTKETLYEIYQKHLKFLYELGKSNSTAEKVIDGASWLNPANIAGGLAHKVTDKTTDYLFGDKKDKNGYEYSKEIIEKGTKLYESIRNLDKTAESSQASTDTRLFNDVDPHTIYQEMFYDLRYYDQRGRMLRAFPGFQMFIIQEGDYFGKYKFWDNMYGFNAIQSIDVHRSRKIAADTAVISMTNVYSNLTTRRTDVDYVDRQLKWWDNYIWNEIPKDLIDKKENEIHKNIYLETGARIHLRMGYGANASSLPVVFNGTITELEIGDLIDIVAQGDGIELGNVISGDPDDDNDGLFNVTEPRDLICSLLSSKGSWFKDFMNNVSDGQLFRQNPLGIMHFGQPFDTNDSTAAKPLGNLLWYNDEYGEVAQNIYSSNGSPTFSQWLHPNGERNDIFHDFSWKRLWDNKFKILNPGDEKNVVVKFYNNTVWDIIQTIAYTSPDYIAAVMPFELRSTLFFGKPYWRAAYQYDSRYEFDAANKTWARHLVKEARRPYMQHKFYTSSYDIIENNIRASEENIYTNVIVNYDGKQTPVLYADADIRYDKQKTRVVEADIVAKFADYYTSEVVATYYGNSALRDNLKDMYKGNLLVMGDPTVKPHDMMYIGDEINDLQGNCLVKSVTHHFSLETGFVTSIEPDLLIVNDDQVILELGKWYYSFASSIGATLAMRYAAKKATRNLVNWLMKPNGVPVGVGKWVSTKGLRHTVSLASDGSKDFQDILKTIDQIIASGDKDVSALQTKLAGQFDTAAQNLQKATGKAGILKDTSRKAVLKSGASFMRTLGGTSNIAKVGLSATKIVRGVASITPVGFIVNSALWVGSEMLFEHYRRYKENLQCVICIPLTYRGQELTAGINNHAGMVYGDNPGRYDRLFDATFGADDGEAEDIFGNSLFELANFFSGSGGVYSDPEKTKELNSLGK